MVVVAGMVIRLPPAYMPDMKRGKSIVCDRMILYPIAS